MTMRKIFLVMLFIPLLVPTASALSIFPSRVCFEQNEFGTYNLLDMFCNETIQTFNPGDVYRGQACVKGNETDAKLYSRGHLNEYLSLSKEDIFLPSSERICVDYSFTLPEDLPRPGRFETFVGLSEKGPKDEGVIVILSRVEQQIWLDIPYPDTYIEASLSASATNTKTPVKLILTLKNFGKTSVDAIGSIIVKSIAGDVVGTVEVPKTKVELDTPSINELSWKAKKAGNYTAIATMAYAEKNAESNEAEFNLVTITKESWLTWKLTLTIVFIALFIAIISLCAYVIYKNYEK